MVRLLHPYGLKSSCRWHSRSDRRPERHSRCRDAAFHPHPGLWYLLQVFLLGIFSGCQSLRDLERFANRHHTALTSSLGIDLKRSPSDTTVGYFSLQMDVMSLCAAIRDWTIAQIPGGAEGFDQLICDGKSLRDSVVPTASGGSTIIAQVALYSAALGGD